MAVEKNIRLVSFSKRKGFFWYRSPGSRGVGDIVAKRNGRIWLIQVKATRKDYTSYTRLTIDGEKKLLNAARRYKAAPVLALVSRNFVWFISVPEEKLLLKGELRPLKYDYRDR